MSSSMMMQRQQSQRLVNAAAAAAPQAAVTCRCSGRAAARGSFIASAQAPAVTRCSTLSRRTVKPCAAAPSSAPAAQPSSTLTSAIGTGKCISSTEVPPFIQRDDMADQLYRWSIIEAGEGGFRNFGLPMNVEPVYREGVLWGFVVGMFKDGVKLADIGVGFDTIVTLKHEWVGRGEDGFPINEGKADEVVGKNIEIWKLDPNPVTEELRSAIRAFCTGLVSAINRYYAFGSVFVDEDRG